MSLEAQADREKNARMTVVGVEAELAEMLAEAARATATRRRRSSCAPCSCSTTR